MRQIFILQFLFGLTTAFVTVPANAQEADFEVTVPIEGQNLHPEVDLVHVSCDVSAEGAAGRTQIPYNNYDYSNIVHLISENRTISGRTVLKISYPDNIRQGLLDGSFETIVWYCRARFVSRANVDWAFHITENPPPPLSNELEIPMDIQIRDQAAAVTPQSVLISRGTIQY